MAYDFSSWVDRLKSVLKVSGKRLMKLILLGFAVPWFGGLVLVAAVFGIGLYALIGDGHGMSPAATVLLVVVIGLLYVGILLSAGYLSAVVGLAAARTIANDATGRPIALLEAYKSALRPGWPTLGWTLLAGLVAMIGSVFCYLPGIYLSFVLSLIVPVMAFEGRQGFTRSIRLMHSNFWPAVGRVAALVGVAAGFVLVVELLMFAVMIPLNAMVVEGNSAMGALVMVVSGVLFLVLIILAAVFGQVVTLCGTVVTYVELRAREQPGLNTSRLAAEANA
ncbi:MAG: hypothetical protein ACRDT1_03735 [Micromonosporaceae bacterium]